MEKIILCLLLVSCTQSQFEIDRYIDGDSFHLKQNGLVVPVRLYGVDCPEMYLNKDKRKPNRLGQKAKNKFRDLVRANKIVSLEHVTFDVFNRSLAIIHFENKTLNEAMIESGLCGFYKKAQKYKDNSFREKLKRISAKKIYNRTSF